MKQILLVLILFISGISSINAIAQQGPVNSPKPATEASFPKAAPTARYSSRVIPAEGGTYGYEILQEGKPMIRQATIPGMPGNKGFASKADAEKVAAVVIGKLKKGEMPPSVTVEEMKRLKVIK